MNTRFLLRALAAPAVALALASCSEVVQPPAEARLTHNGGPYLLECPANAADSTTAVIGLAGGVLQLNGHKVVIPANAVLLPTEFRLVEPVSNYMEIQVRAAGHAHYQFEHPVTMTVSYARCTRTNIQKDNLRIYHTDEATKAILADMAGTDDKTAKTVTTSTDHFSGYIVGGN